MKKINKISDMKLLESFLQVNFIKGFKYIDKVGEVLNQYQDESGNITFDMSPDKLIILNPQKKIAKLKISNIDFWCHFIEPKNLNDISRIYSDESKKVLNVTSVRQISRIGWRNYYVIDINIKKNNLNSLSKLSDGEVQIINLTMNHENNIKSSVRIKLLQKITASKQLALLFDIDTYVDEKFILDDLENRIEKLKETIIGERNKDFINKTLSLLNSNE